MKAHIKLTVSESKRLIAKGVAALPAVMAAMRSGMIAVGTGSTNSYVCEELLGVRIDRAAYRSGVILPTGKSVRDYTNAPGDVLPDLILRDGRPVPGNIVPLPPAGTAVVEVTVQLGAAGE